MISPSSLMGEIFAAPCFDRPGGPRRDDVKTGTMSRDLTEGPVLPALLSFAVPVLIANLLQTFYNLVDMAIVGQFVGSTALSAVSVGSDVMHIITISMNGLTNATQVQVAKLAAVGDRKALNRLIGNTFSLLAAFSIVLTAALLCLAGPVLSALNTPAAAFGDALSYTVTCYTGIIFISGYGAIGAMLRGMGDSRHPMIFIAVSSAANLVLDIIFVAALGMGAFGAALATVMGQGLSFIWALSFLYRRREQFGFDFAPESFRPDRSVTLRIVRLSIPMLVQNMSVQLSTMYINSFIYAYGVEVTAINGIGTKLSTLSHVVCNSLTRSGSVMISQSVSLKKHGRIKKVVLINTAISVCVAGAASALVLSMPEQVFGLFTNDPAVLAWTSAFLPVLVIRLFAFASRSPGIALINGVGKPRLNFITGIFDGVVMRIGLAMLLGRALGMGVAGFWYGNAIGSFGAFLIACVYFASGKWKKAK